MIRLFIYYSIQDKLNIKNIDFSKISNWCSEAVMSSPFQPRERGDKLAEGFTHADMTIGDFDVDFEKSGEIILRDNAKLFGIIEAKMGSNLSQRTKNAPNYNQASRNLACIAAKAIDSKNCKTFFGVVAPGIKIKSHNLKEQVDKEFIQSQIKTRFEKYPSEFRQEKRMNDIMTKAAESEVWVISYEEWLEHFNNFEIIGFS